VFPGRKECPEGFLSTLFFLGKHVVLVAINQMCFREKKEKEEIPFSRLNYGFRSIEWSL